MIWFWVLTLLGWLTVFLIVHHGLRRYRCISEVKSLHPVTLSVVICARNEAAHIQACLQSILDQTHLPGGTEIILVDDHSTDATNELATEYMRDVEGVSFSFLKLQEGAGKKDALRLGLQIASGDVIALTDADCRYDISAFGLLLGALQNEDAQVVFGPVVYEWNVFFERLLAAENLNNQCVTQSFITMDRPIMSNGANMVFRRSQCERYLSTLESGTSSGDDVFFAQSLSEETVVYVRDKRAAVKTGAPHNMGELIQQRLRWSAKSKHYSSSVARIFALVIWILNASFLALFLSPLVIPQWFSWILLLVLIKAWVEFVFHRYWFQFFGVKHRLIDAITLSLVYPFYVTIVGLAAVAGVGFRWKERFYRV